MAKKTYWISCYRAVRDEAALARYAAAAGPAIEGHGGLFLARGPAARWYEGGLPQRVVVVEFPSLEAAVATHDSPEYQAALALLGDAVDRDLRLVEGV
ncbi:MAG: DUF1330 domain-containing protein [Thermoanaerobaculia bacterium]